MPYWRRAAVWFCSAVNSPWKASAVILGCRQTSAGLMRDYPVVECANAHGTRMWRNLPRRYLPARVGRHRAAPVAALSRQGLIRSAIRSKPLGAPIGHARGIFPVAVDRAKDICQAPCRSRPQADFFENPKKMRTAERASAAGIKISGEGLNILANAAGRSCAAGAARFAMCRASRSRSAQLRL